MALAFFMENFDATVLTTALPSLASSLQTTVAAASVGITAYFVSIAIFIPLSGWMADRVGTRTTFTAAMVLFAISSLACAFSDTLFSFACARALQGMAGAMMVPVGRLIILKSASRSQLVRAMSLVTTPALLGSVLGPPVGGLLSTYADWRMIFFVNIPFAIAGIILSLRYIPQMREQPRMFDWAGFAFSAGAVGLMMVGLQSLVDASFGPWSTALLLIFGAILLGMTVRHAMRHADGLIDATLFRFATFRSVVFGGGLFFISIGAMPYLLPLLLQIGLQESAFVSGVVTLSVALGGLFVKRLAPFFMRRFGFKTVLIGNTLIASFAMASCALFGSAMPIIAIAAVLFAFGLARSLQFAALNTIVYADVPPDKASRATSLADTLKQLWQGLGVSIAALALHIIDLGYGGPPRALPFELALLAMALLGLGAALVFQRLAPDAGIQVSGHVPR